MPILVKCFKWMPLFIYGLEIIKRTFIFLSMTPQVSSLVLILTTRKRYTVITMYFIRYLPITAFLLVLYTDKRTVFEYKKSKSSRVEDDTFTQFSYACKQLGVE